MKNVMLAVVTAAGVAGSAVAHDVVDVGVNSAGALVGRNRAHHAIELMPSVFPGINGWISIDFGFEALFFDAPTIDMYVPNSASNISFQLLSADPGIGIMRDGGSGEQMEVGEFFSLGNPYFHIHPTFQNLVPSYDTPLRMQVQLIDTAGIHAASAPITLEFITAPAPGALGLLGLVAIAGRRHR